MLDRSETLPAMTTDTDHDHDTDDCWKSQDYLVGYLTGVLAFPGIASELRIDYIRYAIFQHAKASGSEVLLNMLCGAEDEGE